MIPFNKPGFFFNEHVCMSTDYPYICIKENVMDVSSLLSLLPFVLLFLVHHFLVGPLLYRKLWLYLVLTALLLGLFGIHCFQTGRPLEDPPRMERPAPPMGGHPEDGPGGRPGPPPGDKRPLQPQWLELLVGLFIIAGDVGLLAHNRMKKNERQMEALRAESLNQQLESLRYQINPHFFMNTLNNIQSLIYTDPEKATEAVSEFSKLMRIVLYEGNAPTIPLAREMEYLRHYLSLMQLRYPEKVRIEAMIPDETGEAVVPPLMMASFVENAFKHGISYQQDSFVRLSVEATRNRILFHCTNSCFATRQTEQHGIGMDNVRKRLSLLYEADYVLRISEESDIYDVLLDIPTQPRQNV